VVRPLAEALIEDGAALEGVLGRVAVGETNPFTALNAAFLGDGVVVKVAAGRVPDRPILLVFVSAPGNGAPRVHPRVVVLVGDGAEAVVMEEYVSLGDGDTFTNPVTEIDLGANASLDHYRVQRESERAMHFGETAVRQGRDSRFTGYSLSLGGRLVRQDIGVTLAGEGSECTLNGLYVLAGSQHADHHTRVDHAASHTTSRELYKGVLDGKATGVFNGWVRIREGVAKIDAAQTNNNLLLSGEALVNTNPELEIFSDDVKATHGATVGQIEDEELFYLRSRGIDHETARHILIQGFAGEMLDRIRVAPLREALTEFVKERF
jgi:Fe-S cluster assembly protein SufD